MSEWISCKDKLPPENIKVWAKNTQCVAVSWLDGFNELGKPSWCHETWEHADDFVTHWKPLEEGDNNE